MNLIQKGGKQALTIVQDLGLLIVAIATIVAIGIEINTMWAAKHVRLADLLLLFIYLEVVAMVAIYLESGKLPIRIPLYIAIVAMARYLILDIKEMDSLRIMAVAGAALILAVAVLAIRYGHIKFPYGAEDRD
jgi:protein PsiE